MWEGSCQLPLSFEFRSAFHKITVKALLPLSYSRGIRKNQSWPLEQLVKEFRHQAQRAVRTAPKKRFDQKVTIHFTGSQRYSSTNSVHSKTGKKARNPATPLCRRNDYYSSVLSETAALEVIIIYVWTEMIHKGTSY